MFVNCPKCNPECDPKLFLVNVRFCGECGTRTVNMLIPKCGYCGMSILPSEKFCTGCGRPRKEALQKK